MRAFRLALAMALLASAAYSDTSAFKFFGKNYVVVFDRDWQLVPGGLKGSSDCVFSSKLSGGLLYLRGIEGLTAKEARYEIEGERSQAMVGPKESVKEIPWVAQEKAFFWRTKEAALVYFPVDGHWFRGFIRRKVGQLQDPESVLKALKTIEENPSRSRTK